MTFLLLMMLAQSPAPAVANAKVETRSGANLRAAMQAILARPEAAWVGYQITASPGKHLTCSWDGERTSGTIMLEGTRTVNVLYRVAGGRVEQVRPFPSDCQLDGGGLPFIFLTDVKGAESVAWLESLTLPKSDSAFAAIALHGDPASEQALERLASAGEPRAVREKALFWLAQKAEQRAVGVIANAIDNDPEVGVKKKAVFALSQLPNHEGVAKLIEVARTNKTPEVRKEAFFWLGQSKDPRALEFFHEVLAK